VEAEWVYLDGSFVRRAGARVSATDRGFLYGDGFFETLRIVAGRPFRLRAHLERMSNSCRETGWEWEPDGELVRRVVEELVRRNGVREGYLRITVSRGPYTGSLTDLKADRPTLLVDVRPMALPPLDAPPPFVLARSPHRKNERCPLVRHKSLSYQANLLALAEGRRRGADEVFMLNSSGHLAEGAVTNLFLVRGGAVRTPDVGCGLLPGITRAVVRELCLGEGIAFEEGRYAESELEGAEEVFCTNSLRGIVPVRAILDVPRWHPAGRAVTSRLQQLYAALVRAECGA